MQIKCHTPPLTLIRQLLILRIRFDPPQRVYLFITLRFLPLPICKPTFALGSLAALVQSTLISLISLPSLSSGTSTPIVRKLPFPERHPQWHEWFEDTTQKVLRIQNREHAAAIPEMDADDLRPATMRLLH